MEDVDRARLEEIARDVAHLRATLDEYLPLLKAYLDPDQSGPRGAFMRRRLAKANGGS